MVSKQSERPIYSVETVADLYTDFVTEWFDLKMEGVSTFEGWNKPEVGEFSLGLIVGPSGSGKTLLLKQFGIELAPVWDDNLGIISQLADEEIDKDTAEALKVDRELRRRVANRENITAEESAGLSRSQKEREAHFKRVVDKLLAVGFNNVRAFVRPYRVLSTGEKFRADLARQLKSGAVIDEFTSVVDRAVAISASKAVRRYVDEHRLKNVVLASCHRDVVDWLRPDWIFDTSNGEFSIRGLLRRCPAIEVRLYPCKRDVWPMFAPHHYLAQTLGSSARCFLVSVDFGVGERVVGFSASCPLPSGTLKRAWREHRTVILPDFQGLGIGVRVSDTLASIHRREGKRFYSKTAHPRMGMYRDAHTQLWKPTSKYNPKSGQKLQRKHRSSDPTGKTWKNMINGFGGDTRQTFSHEYIGD